MIKESITYKDYNGTERTEDFYFNLSESEIIEMAATSEGDLGEKLKKIVDSKDGGQIMTVFKDLLSRSYGEKSPDGRRFEKKNGELARAFFETEAYNTMFLRMVTDPEYAAKFIEGLMPKNMDKIK